MGEAWPATGYILIDGGLQSGSDAGFPRSGGIRDAGRAIFRLIVAIARDTTLKEDAYEESRIIYSVIPAMDHAV